MATTDQEDQQKKKELFPQEWKDYALPPGHGFLLSQMPGFYDLLMNVRQDALKTRDETVPYVVERTYEISNNVKSAIDGVKNSIYVIAAVILAATLVYGYTKLFSPPRESANCAKRSRKKKSRKSRKKRTT
tara:strand:- start:82 stop:474 length:393 start_codon:yes stop_codon:yes gene_type:complete